MAMSPIAGLIVASFLMVFPIMFHPVFHPYSAYNTVYNIVEFEFLLIIVSVIARRFRIN